MTVVCQERVLLQLSNRAWHGRFLPTTIGNLRRKAHYGSAIGHNGVFIWQNFGLPPPITLIKILAISHNAIISQKPRWPA